jgi:cytochrome c oxidase subunit 2
MRNVFLTVALAFVALMAVCGVNAMEVIHPGGFPTPVGPVAEEITYLYNIIFVIIAVIALVVAVPVCYILWKFRRDKVAKPATFSHHHGIELAWTIIPAIICAAIAIISYRGMVYLRTMPTDAMNVEAVAYQFGWDFYYPDASEKGVRVAVPAPTKDDPEISLPDLPRQTKVLVIPVGKPIVIHATSQDVIHAFFVPHLGVKIDAIPGRINYTWFMADKPGIWLGQCAELCGQAHGEMFFRVQAVPQAEFDKYIEAQRVEAGLTATPTAVVSATEIVSGSGVVSGSVAAAVATAPQAPSSATLVLGSQDMVSKTNISPSEK